MKNNICAWGAMCGCGFVGLERGRGEEGETGEREGDSRKVSHEDIDHKKPEVAR